MTRTFDRLPSFDERSRDFPIRTLVGDAVPRSYTWALGLGQPLDQGNEGACVGFGWAHEIIARPKAHPTLTASAARSLYYYARTLDEWPGTDYDGTSVLAGAKAASSLGYFSEYRWAFGLQDLIRAVGYAGPAVLGLNWYTGMMDTDAEGFIRPTGMVEGGHCVMVNSVSVTRRYFRGPNSWGGAWGRGGYWTMSWEDMAFLLADQGEACIPTQRLWVGRAAGGPVTAARCYSVGDRGPELVMKEEH